MAWPRRSVWWWLVAAVVALAGCTSEGAPPTTMAGREPTETTTSSAPVPPGSVDVPEPSPEELAHYEFMVGCLAEFGIPAEYDPRTGGLEVGAGASQQEALQEALETCRERDGQPTGGLTDEYLREYYPFLVELHACLAELGMAVPELVTEEAFVEGGGEWHPYRQLWDEAAAAETGTTEALQRAEEACPNDPNHPKWQDSTAGEASP